MIKSYTEDDVHKSLKYEIWSSTDPGNKRLDKAFKETGGRGPIYLFFSVNASGHFCGMAEMMTAVCFHTHLFRSYGSNISRIRSIIHVAAPSGRPISGRGFSKSGGSLSVTSQMRIFDISNSSEF